MVEVGPPCGDQVTSMAQSVEQVLIEAFVPHVAIKAFDKAVFHWFAGCDVVPIDLSIFLPFQDRI